jgi:hypothetical protein
MAKEAVPYIDVKIVGGLASSASCVESQAPLTIEPRRSDREVVRRQDGKQRNYARMNGSTDHACYHSCLDSGVVARQSTIQFAAFMFHPGLSIRRVAVAMVSTGDARGDAPGPHEPKSGREAAIAA